MKPRHDVHPAPVVVVGAGIAGLATALELAPTPVLLLSRCRLGVDLASAWAQGGIAAALDPADAPALHAADTHSAGDGLCDPVAVDLVTSMGPTVIERLQHWGVEFDRDAAGSLALGREGGHGRRRIAHVRDATGAAVTHALSARAQSSNSITILEGVEAEELLTDGGIVTGLAARRGAERLVFAARAVVLATGGVGGLYSHTSNPLSARGDGLAIAARAGAVLTDLEFVQFHPTAIDVGRDPMPLATEALRGEGALLVNDLGERFMQGQHELAELAPRDIVARAIWRERQQGRRTYLDARTALGSRFAQRFPTVHAACRAAGIDPASQLIPVAPAAHYHMGGIATDLHGATSLPGLWAVGECAGTGLHGANRLASNSLLEAVVFGVRAAAAIGGSERLAPRPRVPGDFLRQARERTATANFGALRACMEAGVGVVRSRESLQQVLAQLAAMQARTDVSRPFANAVTAGLMIAASALERHESRGGHCRSDFPLHATGPAVRSRLTLAGAERIAAELAGVEPLPVARLVAG